MNNRLKLFVLIIVVITSSGCPAAIMVESGLWLFEFSIAPDEVFAVLLLGSGLVLPQELNELPDGVVATDTFVGMTRWEQNGSQFSMHQDAVTTIFDSTATVESSTQLSGAFQRTGLGGDFFGTFTAMKVAI